MLPTDPVQVVAEAPCIHRSEGPCHPFHRDYKHPECIVAALKAAGALMPVEAQQLRDEVGLYSTDRWVERDHELQEANALLQEALSVLGLLVPVIQHGYSGGSAGDSLRHAERQLASLAEKIEKVIGGGG